MTAGRGDESLRFSQVPFVTVSFPQKWEPGSPELIVVLTSKRVITIQIAGFGPATLYLVAQRFRFHAV